MPGSFMEWVSGVEGNKSEGFSIAPGIVKDNFNLLSEGKVQVHIPSMPEIDPWARVASVGAGSGRGFLWIPQIDDEVLVAFNRNDNLDAYVIGGLWSMMNLPPTSDPVDFLSKKIIKTGVKDSPLAHTIEIDDLEQSIKITTSTSQVITMDPEKISIETSEGLMKITMDMVAVPPAINIESTTGDISLSAPLGKISLDAMQIEISSDLSTDISSTGTVGVTGEMITLN
jgi:phage baseplate assembly protein gpV